MKQAELNKLLRFWQKLLRLQDWKITAKIIKNFSTSNIGQCTPYYSIKECLIKIDPEYLDNFDGTKQTVEGLLVHELLEIFMLDIVKNDKETEKDMAINMITDALVELKNRS